MNVIYFHQDKEYLLTNENLQVGDKTFPISFGKVIGNKYYHKDFKYQSYLSGFPDDPHTIIDLHHSNDKAYEVRTDKGYSPVECYFKIRLPEQPSSNKANREGHMTLEQYLASPVMVIGTFSMIVGLGSLFVMAYFAPVLFPVVPATMWLLYVVYKTMKIEYNKVEYNA